MKNLITLMIAGALMLSLASCSGGDDGAEQTTAPETKPDTTVEQADEETETSDETEKKDEVAGQGALQVVETVWGGYGEDEKFPCGGGDSENMNFEGPGAFDITKIDELDSTLGLPAELASDITDAASFVHMMNANTFTGACFSLKDGVAAKEFAETLKENILKRQWICGIPETLLIMDVDGQHIISAFGANDIIENLKAHVTEEYGNASVLVEAAVNQ